MIAAPRQVRRVGLVDVRVEPLPAPPTDAAEAERHGHPVRPRPRRVDRFPKGAFLVRLESLEAAGIPCGRDGSPG